MRAIDAEELKRSIAVSALIEDQKTLEQIIDEQPTIEERKMGEWIIRDNPGTGWYRVTCSECGEDVTSTAPCIGFFPNAKVIWDFCPWCGARMEKSDETQNT